MRGFTQGRATVPGDSACTPTPAQLEAFNRKLWGLAGPEFLPAALEEYLAGPEHAAARVPQTVRQDAGVAVLPLSGVIWQQKAEAIGAVFDNLVRSEQVRAIVLDVDSPGGEVFGTPELAERIYRARGRKPIVAAVNSLMASAAYWIGTAADEVVMTPSGEVGSIGVWSAHIDASKMYQDIGWNVTLIKAGKFKVEGNPFGPLEAEARAFMQSRVDDYFGMFVHAVARHRGRNVAHVRGGFGQGRVLGATQALAEGMIDRVQTVPALVAQLVDASWRSPTGRVSSRDPRRLRLELAERELRASTAPAGQGLAAKQAHVAALEAAARR